MKNKSVYYLFALLIFVFIGVSVLGVTYVLYSQRDAIKPLLKTLYFDLITFKEKHHSHADVDDTGKEIKISVEPLKPIGPVSPLLYGSNLEPKMETEYDIIKFIKYIGITCFRFPGGGSPGYHWKQGTFDFTERYQKVPLRDINYAIEFCKRANTRMIVQVNVESGTAEEAAAWVEYMNKQANFPVEYWELGNEVYGDWDKGYMNGAKYAQVIKEYARAMKQADPSIKIGTDWAPTRREDFNSTIISQAGEYIDFLSVHWYPNHINTDHIYEGRIHPTPKEVMANYLQIPVLINRAKEIITKYAPQRTGKIEFTFLEWDGAWDGPGSDFPPYSTGIIQWSLANAIFHADCFGEFAKNGVTVSTHYNLQAIAHGLIRGWDRDAGWGGQRWDGKIIRPKAFALKLFAEHFGDIMVESKIENSPYYYKARDWWPDSYSGNVPYISCYASKSSKENKLCLVLINKHEQNDYKTTITLNSVTPKPEGKFWLLNGPSLEAQNEQDQVSVRIKEFKAHNLENSFDYTIPARSVSMFEIEY